VHGAACAGHHAERALPGRQRLCTRDRRAHRLGEMARPAAFAADSTSAMAPHALGLAMDVPFISCRLCCVL